jgi:glycosyltransferase involved in cell wall biosynthesis
VTATLHVVVPDAFDDPQRPSGGNTYDRRLCESLGRLGWSVHVHTVPGPWPSTTGAAAKALAHALSAIPDDAPVIVDGLVGCGLPEAMLPEAKRLQLMALVHMPLGSADGPEGGEARAREDAVLAQCAAVIATSEWSRRWLLTCYGLEEAPIAVAEPGVDLADTARGTASGGSLLCIAAVTPIKGHDVLVDALAEIRDLSWSCRCVGSTAIDADFVSETARRSEGHGISDRVTFGGPLTGGALDRAYAAADVLVVASRAETYGMVVTEALARGLPVIATDVGGVRHAMGGQTGHEPGVLVPAAAPSALALVLCRWLTDSAWRRELRMRAQARRGTLTPWSATATRVAEVVTAISERSTTL